MESKEVLAYLSVALLFKKQIVRLLKLKIMLCRFYSPKIPALFQKRVKSSNLYAT